MQEQDKSKATSEGKVHTLEESRLRREGGDLVIHTHQIKNMADVRPLSQAELDELKIIYAGMHNREALNAFREIRTKLFQHAGKENFLLMVTSACDQGGGSFTAVNLGAAVALDRSKTAVVVDCNLHHPHLHLLLGQTLEYGMVDYLEDPSINLDDIIYASGISRLRIIPAGKECEPGVELFSSKRMKDLLLELKSRYSDRCVVLDAPPITSSADSRILQELCDFIVLVVPYGRVSRDQVLSAIDAIDRERLVGIIFNDF
jgi:protein-tyrosine kinase